MILSISSMRPVFIQIFFPMFSQIPSTLSAHTALPAFVRETACLITYRDFMDLLRQVHFIIDHFQHSYPII